MNSLLRSSLTAISSAALLPGCVFDSGIPWKSGNFQVVWIDTLTKSSLNYDLGGGSSIGIVDACVFAAGANEKYVAAARISPSSTAPVVYVIDKAQYSPTKDPKGSYVGFYSEQDYPHLAAKEGFPKLEGIMPKESCSSKA